MKKIGFIGAYDKTDLILYVAKILTTLNKTTIIPAKVTKVAISSFPAILRIWLITAVSIPIAAILNIISISIFSPNLD